MKRFIRVFAVIFVLPIVFMSASCGQDEELVRYKSASIKDLESYETTLAEENFYYEEDWEFIVDTLEETKEKINAKDTKTSESVDALCAEARVQIDSIAPRKSMWVIYGLQEAFDLGLLTHEDLEAIADNYFDVREPEWREKERNAVENAYAGYVPDGRIYLNEYKALTAGEYVYCGTFNNCYAIYRGPNLDLDLDLSYPCWEIEEVIVDGVWFGYGGHYFRLWKMADVEESKPIAIDKVRSSTPWKFFYSEATRQVLEDLIQEATENINSAESYKEVVALCEEAQQKIASAEKEEEVLVKIDGVRADYHYEAYNGREYALEISYEFMAGWLNWVSAGTHTVTIEFRGSRSSPHEVNYGVNIGKYYPKKEVGSSVFGDILNIDYGENLWEIQIELTEPNADVLFVLAVSAYWGEFDNGTFYIPMKIN